MIYRLRNFCKETPAYKFCNRRGYGVAHRFISVVIASRQLKAVRRSHQSSRFTHSQKTRMDLAVLFYH